MNTDAINHDPAITFIQTGFQQPGRPSMGAWLSYGLGSENQNLPAFVVLLSQAHAHQRRSAAVLAAVGERLPAVELSGRAVPRRQRAGAVSRRSAGHQHDARGARCSTRSRKLNTMQHEAYGDPEIETRIAQYEMAYRMQTSVPELMDLSKEPERVFELYGPESRKPGTYAANCLLARRLAERDVRFIQLYHRGWDQHNNLPRDLALQCKGTDQPTAALITDLKQRGLLDDTLVVWGGEFGRTVYSQGKLTDDQLRPRPSSAQLQHVAGRRRHQARASCSARPTTTATTSSSDPVSRPRPAGDDPALLGIDHTKLTYRFQGRDFRLTDVHGEVVKKILA